MARQKPSPNLPAARPSCVDPEDMPPVMARQCKVDVAVDVLSILSELKRPCGYREDDNGRMSPIGGSLSPKEEAAYLAALNRLETYLDSPD